MVTLAGSTIDPGLTTLTVAVAFGTKLAVAVMVAVPAPTPVTGMTSVVKELPGEIDSVEVLLLKSVTVTPPKGAGDPRVIGKPVVCPRPTVGFCGRTMAPGDVTVTLAVAFATVASPEVAVIVAVPGAFPV